MKQVWKTAGIALLVAAVAKAQQPSCSACGLSCPLNYNIPLNQGLRLSYNGVGNTQYMIFKWTVQSPGATSSHMTPTAGSQGISLWLESSTGCVIANSATTNVTCDYNSGGTVNTNSASLIVFCTSTNIGASGCNLNLYQSVTAVSNNNNANSGSSGGSGSSSNTYAVSPTTSYITQNPANYLAQCSPQANLAAGVIVIIVLVVLLIFVITPCAAFAVWRRRRNRSKPNVVQAQPVIQGSAYVQPIYMVPLATDNALPPPPAYMSSTDYSVSASAPPQSPTYQSASQGMWVPGPSQGYQAMPPGPYQHQSQPYVAQSSDVKSGYPGQGAAYQGQPVQGEPVYLMQPHPGAGSSRPMFFDQGGPRQ